MDMNKLFTVVICAYNAQNRLRRTIDSVLQQENFEYLVDRLLLIDNNSTDKTKEIMNEYAEANKNVQYIFEKRQGLSYARLAGAINTKTDWIVFVDDDNILQKDWLVQADLYIKEHHAVGIFNGAIVPMPESSINDHQALVLKSIYRNLACSHLDEKDVGKIINEDPYSEAIGAGMVVRSKLLKELAHSGWTRLTDRRGSSLASGGDTEISIYVTSHGYNRGYNPQMLIRHFMPLSRLDEKYAVRLLEAQMKSELQLKSSHHKFVIYRFMIRACIYSFLSVFNLRKEKRFKRKLCFMASKFIFKNRSKWINH